MNIDVFVPHFLQIRFQHSRIRPQFSGCGRGVVETLEEIRQGKLEPCDLPPIQVIIGAENTGRNKGLGEEHTWYFSLNNRRLWVLKQCHREGLLDNERYNNKIGVRAREVRSQTERMRYTVDNCALEAKLIREGSKTNGSRNKKKEVMKAISSNGRECKSESDKPDDLYGRISLGNIDESDDDDDEGGDSVSHTNPFSALS